MKLTLLLLLLVFFSIIPAQLAKHDHHSKHGKKDHSKDAGERHGHKHGHKHGKHGRRVEDLLADYGDDDSEDDDDEDEEKGSCQPNPCLNNGVCEDKKGKFKCKCPKPFKGRVCEKGKNVCKKHTCGYGQCVLTSVPPYFECKCKAPFKPPNCKKIAPCEWNPCQNGGTCVKDGQDFDCNCKEGFSGKFCQVGPNDCYKGNGESYRGTVSETEEGDDCLFWNSYFLLGKRTNPFQTSNDNQGLGPHNYCRNPDGDSKPWCFTRSGQRIRWEHCNVRKCPTEATPTTPLEPKPATEHPAVIHPNISLTTTATSQTPSPVTDTTSQTPSAGTDTTSQTPSAGTDTTSQTPSAGTDTTSQTPSAGTDTTSQTPSAGTDTTSQTPTAGTDTTGHPTTTTPTVPTGITDVTATTTLPPETQFATCGIPQPQRPIHRIYGGIKALPGGRPWQASIQVRPKGTNLPFNHVCGGTLIRSCWVLTAGHCIDNKKDFRVVLGVNHLAKPELSQQTLEVVQTIIHEQYHEGPNSVSNDIALLRLKDTNGKCADETQFVKTACVPSRDFPDGTVCSISGWGATAESLYGTNQLLDADVLLIAQDICSSSTVYGKDIDNTVFCAGYLDGGVDSCQGDSGGPLTCVENEIHYIYGIVSWGDSCGLKNKPGVYTRVPHYVDWINRTIARAGV